MEKRLDRINDELSIYQYTDGFSYGTDAVLLAAYLKIRPGMRGAELGTGTGIISILLAYRSRPAAVYAFEIQPEYAALAEENVARCGFSDTVKIICEDVRNITPAYPQREGMEGLDFVFSNPPYLKMTSGFLNGDERKLVSRHEKYGGIGDICTAAASLLRCGGDFFLIYRACRLCDLLCAMREAGIEPKEITFVHSYADSPPALFLCRGKKQAAPSMKVTPPLILHEKDGSMTRQMAQIYEKGEIRLWQTK